MKNFLTLLALGLSLSLGVARAADAPAAKTPQQNKMGMCNKDAVGKKGDERKAFMKQCLSNKSAAVPATPATPATPASASDMKNSQQGKMTSCNKDAGKKKLKGDARKAFMKDCLSK